MAVGAHHQHVDAVAPDALLHRRHRWVAGVDEVGRGALAGPVTAAAVILAPGDSFEGLADSKTITAARRRRLNGQIRKRAVAWAVVHVAADEVDRINVLEASRRAMTEAVGRLRPIPECVVTDAMSLPGLVMPVVAEARADGRYRCVAAAAILAKVARDRLMEQLAVFFPAYGWERNRGYGVAEHLGALARFGASPLHRRSFAPVACVSISAGSERTRWPS